MAADLHFGHFDGQRLRAGSLAAMVKSYSANTPLQFTVEPERPRRSKGQNSYLHVLFTIAANAMNAEGYGDGRPWTKDRVKQLCKLEGLYPAEDRVIPGGEVKAVPLDTRDLDKYETMQTIDKVIGYFAELGIVLPQPNEQLTISE